MAPNCTIKYCPDTWSAKESRLYSKQQGIIMGYSASHKGVLVSFPHNEHPNVPTLADTLWFDATCVTPNA